VGSFGHDLGWIDLGTPRGPAYIREDPAGLLLNRYVGLTRGGPLLKSSWSLGAGRV